MKDNKTYNNNIYNNKYIDNKNVGKLYLPEKKINIYYLITHDNIPLFEYLYDYTYDNNNNNTETGKLVDFNLIPVLQDIKGFYITKQTYMYVLQYNEYDLGLNKNNKNMEMKKNISKIDKSDELISISRILYENRIDIIIYYIHFFINKQFSEYENQSTQSGYKSFLLKSKNKFIQSNINENTEYLLDKLYFINSIINDNSLLFYKYSEKINNYFKKKIDTLLNKNKFIIDYFSKKEEENIKIKSQSGGKDIIILNNNLSNKQIFINFLTNIHKHDNKYFRGLELLNMENSVDAIKNYYVKNKLTDIEYRDALQEANKKIKEFINSNYLQLSRYLNYYFPNKGKFAYEYINLKNARKFLFLKKMFPTDFHKVFNLFNSLLDTEIDEILKLIKFKNKKNTYSLKKNQNIKNISKKKKTIINLNKMNMSNIKSELFKFLSNPTIFNFNGMYINPLLLFQKYPDIFHQYYPKYYESIYLLDDNTFNNIIAKIYIPNNNNFKNV